jgi:hypothetical protein
LESACDALAQRYSLPLDDPVSKLNLKWNEVENYEPTSMTEMEKIMNAEAKLNKEMTWKMCSKKDLVFCLNPGAALLISSIRGSRGVFSSSQCMIRSSARRSKLRVI